MTASLLRHGRLSVATLYLLLATPAARGWLEATMIGHMLLQIPLLTAIGIISSRLLPERCQHALLASVGGVIPCLLAALFVSGYWMLPRALDAALTDPLAEIAKFLSLPMFVGLPIGLAWKRLRAIGRGFVWTNFFSMLAVLGWLYIVAPVRLCNNYLADQQGQAGWWMVTLALLLFFWWLVTLFVGDSPAAGKRGYARSMRSHNAAFLKHRNGRTPGRTMRPADSLDPVDGNLQHCFGKAARM